MLWSYVSAGMSLNVGIGMPTALLDCVPQRKEVFIQSENGLLGISGVDTSDDPELDAVDAAKNSVTLFAGASAFDSASSFGLLRGGHVELGVLGAYQVSSSGDLANWRLPGNSLAGIGGAADICAGVREVWVMTKIFGSARSPKLVPECTYPVTDMGVVSRIFTDAGVFSPAGDGFVVENVPDGISIDSIRAVSGDVNIEFL